MTYVVISCRTRRVAQQQFLEFFLKRETVCSHSDDPSPHRSHPSDSSSPIKEINLITYKKYQIHQPHTILFLYPQTFFRLSELLSGLSLIILKTRLLTDSVFSDFFRFIELV